MKHLYFAAALFVAGILSAQNPANRDATFNDFPQALNQYFVDEDVKQSAVLPDGKIFLLEGERTLVRLDGNLRDPGFAVQGSGFGVANGAPILQTFAIQPDGKILVGGDFTTFNGQTKRKLLRLLPDGTLDASFNFAHNPGQYGVMQIVVQPDGKILIVADTSASGPSFYNNLFRVNADGSADATFNPVANYRWDRVTLLPDGKMIAAHNTNNDFYSARNKISRLNADGSFDATFTTNTFSAFVGDQAYILKIVQQTDGKLLVLGHFTGHGNGSSRNMTRINADGSFDSSFAIGNGFSFTGTTYSEYVYDALETPDHKIVVAGSFDRFNGQIRPNVLRLNSNGSFDSSFADTGTYLNLYMARSLSSFADGKILVSGTVGYNRKAANYIAKMNPDGTQDLSFNNFYKGFFNGPVSVVYEMADGRLLVGGSFHSYNGQKCHSFTRLNPDGSLDPTLTFGGLGGFSENFSADVTAITVRTDGKIYLAGRFTSYNGAVAGNIIRINPDGTRDATFNANNNGFDSPSAYPGKIKCIVERQDGGVVVAGDFNNYGSNSMQGLVGLGPSGFGGNYAQDIGNNVTWLRYQPDGKLLVGLSHAGGGNYSIGAMKRFSNYALDNTFVLDAQVAGGSVISFDLLADGRILLQGEFTIDGVERRLVRLMPNGALDTSFNFTQSDVITASYVVAAPDQKAIVAGYGPDSLGRVLRLNANGSIDPDFEMQTLDNYAPLLLQSQTGKAYLFGYLRTYAGQPAWGLIRITGEDYYFVQGQNRLDLNGDGCDGSDALFSNLKYQVSGTAGSFDFTANTTGNYTIGLTEGSYTVTPVFENPSYFNVSPASLNVTFPATVSPVQQSFCVTPNGVHPDLEVLIFPLNDARPGFDAQYKLSYRNKGNTVQNGSVAFTFDDERIDFVTATPSAAAQTTGQLQWDFSNLQPFETRDIRIVLNVNTPIQTPPVQAGDLLDFTAAATSAQQDETPQDNSFAFHQTVVNSFDPNDKTCLQGNLIEMTQVGDFVHYVIRFENTGSFAAQDIRVRDIIDTSKYEIGSLQPLSGSGLFTTRIVDGNTAEFFFENINLPFADATNDGYVAFRIKTKSTLVPGDFFSNTAAIYFDYNHPIVTNTATTYVETLAVADFQAASADVKLYPNPASNQLTLESEHALQSMSVYNMAGQLLLQVPLHGKQAGIDVLGLPSGNYLVKIQGENGTTIKRLLKK